jgi:dihydroorotase
MHEGAVSTRLGLPGYPSAAEEVQIARDIALAEMTGAHIHICHVSTAGGVALVRAAKDRGVHVTAEATPHHLTLTDRWVLGSLGSAGRPTHDTPSQRETRSRRRKKVEPGLGLPSWLDPTRIAPYDPSTRVSPPLRSEEDVEALIEGLRDGTIDAIATDHAPHAVEEKESEFDRAPHGTIGLETALAVALTELVEPGLLTLSRALEALSSTPARLIGARDHGGPIEAGRPANLVVFDPQERWAVEPPFVSKSRNSAFTGRTLRGRVRHTVLHGELTVSEGKATR